MNSDSFEDFRRLPGITSLCLCTAIWLLLVFSYTNASVSGQFLPPPPPISDQNMGGNRPPLVERDFQFPKGFQPPSIGIMTKDLSEGKNVFRINISSEAPIENCKITFTKGDTKKTEDCVADRGTVFKALIDAKPPYQTVNIYARDIYGDSSSTVEKIQVVPTPPLFESIWNSLNQMGNLTNQLFQSGIGTPEY
jgi:hypothetical protein